jgi:minimal PKS acyl carrier protein
MDRFTMDELRKTIDSCLGSDRTESLTDATADTDFDDLGYDSLSIYEFVTALQDNLHISITDEEIEGLRTPRVVIDFINRRLADAA